MKYSEAIQLLDKHGFKILWQTAASFIGTRTGVGMTWDHVEDNNRRESDRTISLTFIAQPYDAFELGICKFIMAECHLEVRVGIDIQNGAFSATPHLDYQHHNGGHNGYELNFRLIGNRSGELKEVTR